MSSGNQPDPPAGSVCLSQLTNATTAQQYRSSVFVEADASFASATPNVMYGTGESAVGLNTGAQHIMNAHTAVAVETVPANASMEGPIMSSVSPVGLTALRSVEDSAPSPAAQPESKKRKKSPSTTKQHQLPMFLTKTYHMIDRCDHEIATWSASGDNFVVKNVEKFASTVLPQYFKHSNFSSFARQLNFYGFRKLKAEPILTADYDARTASYVRFFHEKFQKDKPDLLCHIKRATKSEIQSKDDVETLRVDVIHLNEVIKSMQTDFDRKISEMTFELNNKIAHLSSMYEQQLIVLQHQRQQQQPPPMQQQVQVQQPQQVQQVSAHQQQVSTVSPNGQQQVYQAQQGLNVQQQTISNGQQHNPVQIPVSVYQGQHTQNGTNQSVQQQHVSYQAQPNVQLPTTVKQPNTSIPNTIKPVGNSMMDSLHKACLTLKSPAGPQATQPTQTSTHQPGQLSGAKRELPDELKLPPPAS